MIRPIPFWPSLEPCTKLTAIAEITSTRRFQNGGCFLSSSLRRWSGVLCIFDSGRHHFRPSSTRAATRKPAIGENTSDAPISIAFCQFTPSASGISLIRALARPTPRIEPIRVWELEAGIPKYLGTWYFGIPASSSHTLIGSILGVGLANALLNGIPVSEGVNWQKAVDIGASLVFSPIAGLLVAGLILVGLKWWRPQSKMHKTPEQRR